MLKIGYALLVLAASAFFVGDGYGACFGLGARRAARQQGASYGYATTGGGCSGNTAAVVMVPVTGGGCSGNTGGLFQRRATFAPVYAPAYAPVSGGCNGGTGGPQPATVAPPAKMP